MTRDEARAAVERDWFPLDARAFGGPLRVDDSRTAEHEWGWVFVGVPVEPHKCPLPVPEQRYAIDRVTGYSVPVVSSGVAAAARRARDWRDRCAASGSDRPDPTPPPVVPLTRAEARAAIEGAHAHLEEWAFKCPVRIDDARTAEHEWGWVFSFVPVDPDNCPVPRREQPYAIDRITGLATTVGSKGVEDAALRLARWRSRAAVPN
jgi:hypothetical protein